MSAFQSRRRSRRQFDRMPAELARQAEQAEARVLLAAAIDGSGNNLANPELGSTNEAFIRLADAEYADGISAVGGEDRPSARVVSNVVSDDGDAPQLSQRMMSAMVYVWGQFIDHDLTLTASDKSESMSIAVPTGDPSFDPNGTGTVTINMTRSAYDSETGTDTSNPREQLNQLSAFLDGSMVYGSTDEVAASLRTFEGGKLKTSDGDLLPMENGMFVAGDIRVNENVELIAMQTLFVREHNYQAEKIAAEDPLLSDEEIYQKARAIVIGEIQAITFNEWLPALLGKSAISKYTGYDSSVDPSISNEFSTSAFRFGHSLLGDDIEFLDNNGLETRDSVTLAQAFFNPSLVSETGIDPLLKYLSSDLANEIDTEVVDSVRNFLFGAPGAGGLDLAALNIQRGRDHGLADYNTVRKAIGLNAVDSFDDITSDKQLATKLEELYGTVDNIDLWIGGLAEDHLPGSSLGETFSAIIVDQFERLRDGDRYWYQSQFSGSELAEIKSTSLADIIERNTTLTSIQDNAFFFKTSISGVVRKDLNRDGKPTVKEPTAAGVTVQLVNTDDQSVVATTKTNKAGRYDFDSLDGVATGVYTVQIIGPDGKVLATSGKISITRGDDFETVDVAMPLPKPTKPTPPPKPAKGTPRPNTKTVSVATNKSATSVKGNSAAITSTGTTAASTVTSSTSTGVTTGSTAKSSKLSTGTASKLTSTTNRAAQTPPMNPATLALIDELFATLPKEVL